MRSIDDVDSEEEASVLVLASTAAELSGATLGCSAVVEDSSFGEDAPNCFCCCCCWAFPRLVLLPSNN